jgi:hypothetical protein
VAAKVQPLKEFFGLKGLYDLPESTQGGISRSLGGILPRLNIFARLFTGYA